MTDGMRFDRDDVLVEEVFDECDECTNDCTGVVFTVLLDFRAAGTRHSTGRYCKACAETLAERTRAGLGEGTPQ